MSSIVAKTDLPRPPAQAGVSASHDAIHRQLPTATICGRGGVVTRAPGGPGTSGHSPILVGLDMASVWGGAGGCLMGHGPALGLGGGPKGEGSEFQGLTLADDSQETAPGTVTVRERQGQRQK